MQRARTGKKETKFVCNSWTDDGKTHLWRTQAHDVGLGSVVRSTFHLPQQRIANLSYLQQIFVDFYGWSRLHFPIHSKEEKHPSVCSQKLYWVFDSVLLSNRYPQTFIFCFQMSQGLFSSFFTYSLISCSPPKRIVFGLTRFVCLFWRPALPWSQSCYWVVQTTLDVTTSVGVEQKQQVTGWWESTCSSTFNLQALPSSFAQCSQPEVATDAFFQAPWGTKHQKSQNQHYPNNSKLVESFSNSYPS